MAEKVIDPYCQLCKLGKNGKVVPAYAALKLRSAGGWLDLCANHFEEWNGELGPDKGFLLEQREG